MIEYLQQLLKTSESFTVTVIIHGDGVYNRSWNRCGLYAVDAAGIVIDAGVKTAIPWSAISVVKIDE